MTATRRVERALVSVYHKEGLDKILKKLHQEGVSFVATGGTRRFIESLGFPCETVEGLTGYPAIMGGQVKTLHPKVFGGILAQREDATDREQMSEYGIVGIDLVIVDLYPFAEAAASGAGEAYVIEKLDIGGIALLRAAAKNYKDVWVVASQAQYTPMVHILEEKGAETTLEDRKWFAREAFAVSSEYDTAIFNYFDAGAAETAFRVAIDAPMHLRYGENPHQQAKFFGQFEAMFDRIHGKELSYNNLQDIEAGVNLLNEFAERTFAILKHNNACGIASRNTAEEAFQAALACDPVSAFGGALVTNTVINRAAAEEINKIFFEVIVAPDYDTDALEVLMQKKNRIILIGKDTTSPVMQYRSLLNGVLVQERDREVCGEAPETMTIKSPTPREEEDLLFANKVVKHSKSNAIALVKNKQLCGSGTGQTSRVDALRQALDKAHTFQFDLQGAVMASDAYFPFPDCVEMAGKAGITAIIQPGGSKNDRQSVDYCNEHGIAMVKTGIRHFKH
jgi:phosphoribosylaminoimidazolecarboxamide formyltransferase/IMP cyclohydrolase